MGNSRVQKIRLLKVYETLKKYSDEDNPISTVELINKLNLDGIDATRKTIYDDIKELNAYGFSVETVKQRANKYFLADRDFDLSEIKVMMSAIRASNFLTEEKTESILEKLATLESFSQGKLMLKNSISIGENKTIYKGAYYYINILDTAITNGKQVSFVYTEYNDKCQRIARKNGKRYVVNPISLVFSGNSYYLVTYSDKYNELTLYRIDRMDDVREEDTLVPAFNLNQDIETLKKKMFSMHLGQEIECGFIIDRTMINAIVDKFGSKINFVPVEDNKLYFSTKAFVSEAFIAWCIQYGTLMKVVSPSSVVTRVEKLICSLQNLYSKGE